MTGEPHPKNGQGDERPEVASPQAQAGTPLPDASIGTNPASVEGTSGPKNVWFLRRSWSNAKKHVKDWLSRVATSCSNAAKRAVIKCSNAAKLVKASISSAAAWLLSTRGVKQKLGGVALTILTAVSVTVIKSCYKTFKDRMDVSAQYSEGSGQVRYVVVLKRHLYDNSLAYKIKHDLSAWNSDCQLEWVDDLSLRFPVGCGDLIEQRILQYGRDHPEDAKKLTPLEEAFWKAGGPAVPDLISVKLGANIENKGTNPGALDPNASLGRGERELFKLPAAHGRDNQTHEEFKIEGHTTKTQDFVNSAISINDDVWKNGQVYLQGTTFHVHVEDHEAHFELPEKFGGS